MLYGKNASRGVRIRRIKANELEDNFTVTFEGGSVTYNAMTYCYNALNGGSASARLQNVCKALYQFAEASKVYYTSGSRDDNDPDF